MKDLGTDSELDIEFPAKPEYIRTIRHAVGALARLHEAPDDLVEDIKLAVSEACTTVLPVQASGGLTATAQAEEGGQGFDPATVRLLASRDDDSLVIEVTDAESSLVRAVSGDPAELSTGDLPFERTLSLPLIRGLVDEVSITPLEEGGAAIRMVVSLGRDES